MTEPADPAQRVSALAPLRVGLYRRLWIASAVSGMGSFIQLTAAPWLMLQLTGSALLVSLVTTALLLPQLLLTLPAGALADVMDRRSILLVGHLVSAAAVTAMAVLVHVDAITPPMLLGLTFVLGCGNAIGQPAFQTLVPDLVPTSMLAQAVTLTSASFNVARAIGPSIGGALIAAGLTSTAFGINAASYLGILGVVLVLPRRAGGDPRELALWRSAATGLRYARFTDQVKVLLSITAAFAFTSACVQALLPAFVDADLGGDARDFGILYAAFGLGALAAALTRERVNQALGRHMLAGTVSLFGGAGIVLSLMPTVVGAALALVVAGASWVWTLTTLNASVQTLAPAWVRGRIVSLFVLFFGFQPIGAFVAGAIAERTSAGTAILSLTGACLALGLYLSRLVLPSLLDLRTPVAGEPGWVAPAHVPDLTGSPVVVATTFRVAREDLSAFLSVMRELRAHRLRTGATRWSLFRDSDDPERITEFYSVPDWSEHLAQHRRLDREAIEAIARARDFDRDGSPVSRHLAGIDVTNRDLTGFEDAPLAVHHELHRTDGSLPLGDARTE